jgi:hypothetical protein
VAPAKLPLIVAAIAVPIVGAFFFGGPGLGLAIGALVAAAIVIVAVRQRPRRAIGSAPGESGAERLLVVVTDPLEDAEAIEGIVDLAEAEDGGTRAEVMVLAPARIGFLDRWASDVERARRAAQERLVISVASLAAAGVEAEARVGDENVVQAVEDVVGSFPADEVVLVSAAGEEGEAVRAAAEELRARLRGGFRWVRVSGRGAR